LYGGSVTGDNAEQFLQKKEIDGLLVGGASVNVDSFSRIIVSARNA
jgi:triosephosphate isomerase